MLRKPRADYGLGLMSNGLHNLILMSTSCQVSTVSRSPRGVAIVVVVRIFIANMLTTTPISSRCIHTWCLPITVGNNTSILPLLEQLDREGNKIVSFGSWRAWPRRRFIEYVDPSCLPKRKVRTRLVNHVASLALSLSYRTPIPRPNQPCCFDLKIPMNFTMLQAYNCDRQKPGEKEKQMPAEKQIYRPDYVLHHFIHVSMIIMI